MVHATDLPLGECLCPILTASWSWAAWRFPPAAAEDGASFREPINDAPHQPKDSLQSSAGLRETTLDVSALVLASRGLKNETKIGMIVFFSKEGRMSINSSLFYLKKMQSVS